MRFTIDEKDKNGYYVTLYIDGCEYIGLLRPYKDEEGNVIQ